MKRKKYNRDKKFLGALIAGLVAAGTAIASSASKSAQTRRAARQQARMQNRQDTIDTARNLSDVYNDNEYVDDYQDKVVYRNGGRTYDRVGISKKLRCGGRRKAAYGYSNAAYNQPMYTLDFSKGKDIANIKIGGGDANSATSSGGGMPWGAIGSAVGQLAGMGIEAGANNYATNLQEETSKYSFSANGKNGLKKASYEEAAQQNPQAQQMSGNSMNTNTTQQNPGLASAYNTTINGANALYYDRLRQNGMYRCGGRRIRRK